MMSRVLSSISTIFHGRYAIYVISAIIIIFVYMFEPSFLSIVNLTTLSRQIVIVGILSIGLTFVMISGEIDLSVASVAVFSCLSTAWVLDAGYGIAIGALTGLVIGTAFGLFNGTLTAKLRIPSLLITLGSMTLARGSAFLIGGGLPIPITDTAFKDLFARGAIGPIPVIFIWLVVVTIVGFLMLHKTVFGRHVFASGSNELAASYQGVNTRLVKLKTLVISGFFAGFAGLILAGRLGTGRWDAMRGTELDAIAATIIGGTALFGGRGSIHAPLIGSLLLTVLTNAVVILGFGLGMEWVVRGALIVLAVAVGRR